MRTDRHDEWPPAWGAVTEEILDSGGVVAVIGAGDVGKSTFCWGLAARSAAAGNRVALIDTDLGQARVGPPATIGLALMGPHAEPDPTPAALAFVGSTTPHQHLLPTVVGLRKLGDLAREEEPQHVIVDTCGWVDHPAARALKEAKFSLLEPDFVVAIQEEQELEPLLPWARGRRPDPVRRLRPARAARQRDRAERQRHRGERFREYFRDAETLELEAVALSLLGTSLWAGQPLPKHVHATAADLLGSEVAHAEQVGEQVLLVCEDEPTSDGLRAVREFLPELRVAVRPRSAFRGRLVGLLDAHDLCLTVGLISEIDFAQRRLVVRCRPPGDGATGLAMGALQLNEDFTEAGRERI